MFLKPLLLKIIGWQLFSIYATVEGALREQDILLRSQGKIGWLSNDLPASKLKLCRIKPECSHSFTQVQDSYYLVVLEGALTIQTQSSQKVLIAPEILHFSEPITISNDTHHRVSFLLITSADNLDELVDPHQENLISRWSVMAPMIDSDKERSFFKEIVFRMRKNKNGLRYSKTIDIKAIVFRKNRANYDWSTPHNTPRMQMVFNLRGATELSTVDADPNENVDERVVRASEFFILTDVNEKGLGHSTSLIQDGLERLSLFIPLADDGHKAIIDAQPSKIQGVLWQLFDKSLLDQQ